MIIIADRSKNQNNNIKFNDDGTNNNNTKLQ